jgi:hypothetical protein
MEQQPYKRSRLSSSFKEQQTDKIILNYGIEIEAVFELLNEHIVYNQFINFYLNCIKEHLSSKKINNHIILFVKILNTCLNKPDTQDIQRDIDLLKQNIIYNKLTPKKTPIIKKEKKEKKPKKDEGIDDFWSALGTFDSDDDDESDKEIVDEEEDAKINNIITTELSQLINPESNKRLKETDTDITAETKKLIKDWYDFLSISIKIIKHTLEKYDSPYNISDVINTLNITDSFYITPFGLFNDIFDLTSKIKLFNIESDINLFYTAIPEDDEIFLCLIPDESVFCDKEDVYTTITSGKVVKSHKLLNQCEFITQPFKTIDDVIKKLHIFFSEPKIKNTLLNCDATSQHVHISFNNSSGIIKPDIYLVLSIVCVCYHFQDEIFTLFLKTRLNNEFCQKLNFNDKLPNHRYDITNNYSDNYIENIIKICNVFYKIPSVYHYLDYQNRYYWLNILNLYKKEPHDDKPYTIEFRIKHGSTDAEELGNFCKLYENIINYAIELLKDGTLKKITNIKDFKIAIETIMNIDKEYIYNEKILKTIGQYFTASAYTRGLNKLNQQLRPQSITNSRASSALRGGKKQNIIYEFKSDINSSIKQNIIDEFISDLKNKEIYRFNSFGIEYIGNGLATKVQNNLKAKFLKNDTLINKDLKEYLNSNNIYYDIPIEKFEKLVKRS